MSKPKGTRDKATLAKQEKAATLLEGQKALMAVLTQEMREAEQAVLAGQIRMQELNKKITACNREIASLKKMILEKQAREKTEEEMKKIRDIIDRLVESGLSADEIIRQIGYDPDASHEEKSVKG